MLKFKNFEIRTGKRGEQYWFVLKDIVQVLGFKSVHYVKENFLKSEQIKNASVFVKKGGHKYSMNIVSSDGVVELANNSTMEYKQEFIHWFNSLSNVNTVEKKEESKMENQEMKEFNFNGANVRVTMVNDEPYFVGKDVAKAIGYKDYVNALKAHVKPKYKRGWRITTSSGSQETTVISEPGLYQLASQSKLPSAEEFQDWVYEKVLPSIRKHGVYATPQAVYEMLQSPENMIKVLQTLKDEQDKNKTLTIANQEMKPKADYCDMVLQSPGLINTNVIAKDYGMSAQKFNQLLYSLGVQYKHNTQGIWELYSQYHGLGWMRTVTKIGYNKYGEKYTSMYNKWTQKGRLGLYDLLKDNNILPVMEQQK